MTFLLALAGLLWIVVPFRWLRARPEWGVALGLIPSLFLKEDLHENFFTDQADHIVTFHSFKIIGFLRPTEVVMILLTVVLLSVWRKNREQLRTPLDKPIMTLLVFCPVAAIVSIMRGADPIYALAYNSWRSFWWSLLFFYFCLWAIKEDRVEKAFTLFFVAILLRMMFGVVKFLLGFGETHLRYPDTHIVFWDGLDLHLASSLLTMAALLLFEQRSPVSRLWLLLGLSVSIFTIIFSLRRTPIANAVFAFAILFLVFPVKHKGRLLAGLLVIIVLGIGLLSLGTGQGVRAPTDVVIERVAEIFTVDPASVDEFHWFDPIDQFVAIMESPISGTGFGIPFKRTFLILQAESTFSHNAYLFVWGGMGILGLVVYLLFYYRLIQISKATFIQSRNVMIVPALLSVILTSLAQGLYSTTNFTSGRMPFTLAFVSALLIRSSLRVEDLQRKSDRDKN